MANTDKNILITPNIGSANEPKIEFFGASSTVGPSTITATIYPTNNGTLSFDGSEGSLFSISNNLSTGSIFSVNPISGIPIIDVNADRTIALNPYGGNTGIGLTNPSFKLDVNGTVGVRNTLGISESNGTGNRLLISTSASGAVFNQNDNSNILFQTAGVTRFTVAHSTGNVTATGTVQGTQLISTIATGTAPLSVTSTTVVTNLNADTVDGIQASSFYQMTNSPSTPGSTSGTVLSMGTNGSSYDFVQSHTGKPLNLNPIGNTVQIAGNTAWHAGNDGSGSGLDADLLDGLNAASTNTASTIVARDASGNFSAGTITASLTGSASNNVLKAGDTMTGQLISTLANNTATGGGQIYLNGATGNRIDFNTNGVAAPAFTTRSAGTKLVLYPNIGASSVDYALGIEGSTLWSSVPTTTEQFKWYGGTSLAATLTGTGNFSTTGTITGSSIIRSGGTSSQFLKADGSVDSTTYITSASIGNGTLTLGVSGTGLSGSASFTANQSGNTTFTVTSNATSANTASTIVARDASGNFIAGSITGSNFSDGTGTYNVNLGSGGTEGRGLVAGYSGGSYGGIGYNVRHTTTGANWIAPSTDTSSYLLFNSAGFTFYGAAAGAAGRTLSYTSLATLGSTGNLTLNGTSHTAGGNAIWHAGNDGSGSGLDADTLDGFQWDSSGKNVRATEFYADNWFRNYNSGEGIYNEATGMHWYSSSNQNWTVLGGQSAVNIQFMTAGSATRGYLYADNTSSIGFLNAAAEWGLRYLTTDGTSPNLYFLESANETWSGDPGADVGKIEYHSNRFYIASGSNSTEIARFRYSGTDRVVINNDGSMTINTNTVWHAGNDGTGSGLDADLLDGQTGSYYSNYNNLSNLPTIGNGTLTLGVSGTGLSGSASFTANQTGNTTFTVTSNATNANTANAIVARDGSGNFNTGTVNVAGGLVNTDAGIRINSPGGASYSTQTSAVTGAIKIRIPAAALGSNTMLSFRVQVYQYSTGLSQEFLISGYNYSDVANTWYNVSAVSNTDAGSGFTVRFGKDATSQCVYIGELNSSWSYPQVFVTDFIGGYSNATQTAWATGWNISFETTAFAGVTATRTAVRSWNVNNDGAGSGLDADLLDGIDSASFLRSDAADSWSGTLSYGASDTHGLSFQNASYSTNYLYIGGWTAANTNGISRIRNSNANLHIDSGADGGLYLNHYSTGVVYARTNVVWHAGNDGSGSGLDADLLDGVNSAQFVRSDADTTLSGLYTFSSTSLSPKLVMSGQGGAANYNYFLNASNDTGVKAVHFVNGSTRTADGPANGYVIRNDAGALVLGRTDQTTTINGSSITANGNTIWHAGNDGAGSGLDADLLDGLNTQTSGSAISANQIARSDANGYVFFNYINSNTGNGENPTVAQVIVTNGSDNYYRKATIAHLTSAVQSNASGSWGINVTGSSASCSGNASTATTLQTARNIGGTSFNGSADITPFRSNTLTTVDGGTIQASSTTYAARSASSTPQQYAYGVNWEFKNAAVVGGAGNYAGLLTLAPWVGTTASTGDPTYQLAFSPAAANSTAIPTLQIRAGIDATWGSWATILNSSNYTSYVGNGTLTLAVSGTGLSGSASFTANQSGNTTFTVTSNATSANTASAIVARDASGNFTAGTITAALSGNATTATTATNLSGGSVSASSFETEPGTKADITTRTKSGFWQDGGSATTTEGWPVTSNSWYHLLCTTHSNTANYYSMQFAGDFFNSTDIYYRSTNNSGTTAWNKMWHAGNDGAGTGLDADLLDGLNAASTNTASTIVARDASGNIVVNDITAYRTSATNTGVIYLNSGQTRYLYFDGTNYIMPSSDLYVSGSKVWTAANDGSGSGLDADLLDGISSASFLRSDANATASGRIVFSANNDVLETSTGALGSIEIYQDTAGEDAFMAFHVAGDYAAYFGLKGDINDFAVGGWSMGATYYRLWHAGNDGSGSGLDADLLDGLNAATTGANTIVRTDGSGNIAASGNVTAYSSDRRLKENLNHIESPIEKVQKLNGYTFDWNEKSKELGFTPKHEKNDIGLIAQEVQEVLPQATAAAPFDTNSNGESKSGENYLTIQYERLVPLLVEAIKEQQKQIDELKSQLNSLK